MSKRSFVGLCALLLANLVPVFGLQYWGWEGGDVLKAYWFENFAIGLLTLARMHTAKKGVIAVNGDTHVVPRLFTPFFLFHFGAFTLFHGLFVWIIGGRFGFDATAGTLLLAFAALLASHGVSYWRNWVVGRERDHTSALGAMFRPYGRIAGMHLVVLAFAALVSEFSTQSLTGLYLIVAVKVIADVLAYFGFRVFKMKSAPPSIANDPRVNDFLNGMQRQRMRQESILTDTTTSPNQEKK